MEAIEFLSALVLSRTKEPSIIGQTTVGEGCGQFGDEM